MMGKDDVRRWMRELKKAHTGQELKEMSVSLCRRIMSGMHWQNAGTVLLYHALPDEVDTQLLLDDALLSGKRVLLPKVNGDDLVLCEYTGPDSLTTGAYGILEPNGTSSMYGGTEIDLAIIPGMAFDRHGHRLGRGKGYYDRLLSGLKVYKMGICFPFQLLDYLPCEEHDVMMDGVGA
jgi:5-formyltetrahydrofolate cyclo-ligase